MKKPNETITEHTNAVVPIMLTLLDRYHRNNTRYTHDEVALEAISIYNVLWEMVAKEYDA